MATRDKNPPGFTTNEHDRQEVAKLQARLRNHTSNNTASSSSSSSSRSSSLLEQQHPCSFVDIAPGAHKYVLIRAAAQCNSNNNSNNNTGETTTATPYYIVTSKKGAAYHRNAAEPMIEKLQAAGCFCDIEVTGGGRILLEEESKRISVFGYSYGFGMANHAISQQVIKADERYKDFEVTISDEGY
jgi:phosphohistidine phosphatase